MRFLGALPVLLAVANTILAIAVNWKRLKYGEVVQESKRRRRLRTVVRVVWYVLGFTALIVIAIMVISAAASLFF